MATKVLATHPSPPLHSTADHSRGSQVVSPTEWLEARKALLVKEKEFTKARDSLSAEVRALPMEKVTKPYKFTGPDNKAHQLSDLFAGRKQLLVYHFMFSPESDEGCSSCSFMGDHIPDLSHLNSRE